MCARVCRTCREAAVVANCTMAQWKAQVRMSLQNEFEGQVSGEISG